MWPFLGLVALTTLLLIIIFVGLVYFRPPVYRLEKKNLVTLFELALSGEAREEDWDIFINIPIRYDDDLEAIRLECELLTEKNAIYADSQRRLCMNEDAQHVLSNFLKELSV